MFRRTIAEAVNTTFGPAVNHTVETMDHIAEQGLERAERAQQEFNERLETGTYVIAGAILIGLLAGAVILRHGG